MQLWAQMPPSPEQLRVERPDQFHSITAYETAQGTAAIVFHVFAEKNGVDLDRPARLELRNLSNGSGVYQIIGSHEDGVFTNVIIGRYDITVSAVGYLNTHQEIQATDSTAPTQIDIVLHRDPSAINLADAKGPMSREARKEAKHAVSFLKAGSLADAQEHLERAYKLAPLNSDLNFLLGYLYFQKREYAQAETYLGMAESLSPHSAQTLTLLGRADLAQNNYLAARSALEQAVLADDEEWLPHDLLADAYLHQKEYGKARDEAQIAIARGEKHGKNTAGPAELVLGEALIGLGQKDEAIPPLQAFVKESPENPMVYWARALITDLQKGNSSSRPGASPNSAEISGSLADPLAAVPEPALSPQAWRPPDVDDIKPTLTPGITCPGTQVLAESGKRVQELVQDLARFTADEDLLHKSVDAFGFSGHAETRKYNYVAMVSLEQGDVSVEEYRSDRIAQEGDPDAIGSTGFVLLALVFHPDMQSDFEFACEGQGEWRGEATWLVHFRQRHDRPNRMHSYKVGGEVFSVDLKGRAWITADKFQIVRIEADIVKPVREIQLLSEHQTVEYGPVPFPKKNTMLWLPKDVEIYFDFRKHHYYRRHSFDHYMLFSVDTEEKRKVPPSTPATDGSSEKGPS
jgi:tetratricopeptide (TPR) repeat protein